MADVTQTKQDNLTWQVIVLAGPLVLQNLSQTLLGVVDTYFVSRVGTTSLAAVGLASVMYFAFFTLFRGAANSTVVFVGRAFGENDDAKIGEAVWRSINMIAWLSLSIIILPWLFSQLMGLAAPADDVEVRNLGTTYLQIRTFEIPLIMFNAIVWGFFVGRGNSRVPMILAWITVGINIFLDWVLVLGNLGAPSLGVAGAAYATVIANGVQAILSGILLWSPAHRAQYGTGKAVRTSWTELRSVLKIGLPMGLGDFVEIASFSAFFAMIARLGTDVLAANQIALQYMSVSFTFGIAINMAAASLVSRYLGASRADLAEKSAYRATIIAMIGMGLIGLSYLIAPETLIGLFSQEASVIEAGVTILQMVAFYQIFDALGIVLAGALNGAGDAQFTLWTRTVLAWGGFLPLVWVILFIFDGNIGSAWAGALVYLVGLTVVYFWRFRSGRWKTIELA